MLCIYLYIILNSNFIYFSELHTEVYEKTTFKHLYISAKAAMTTIDKKVLIIQYIYDTQFRNDNIAYIICFN